MLLFKLVCFYESSIALMALDYLWVKLIFDMVNCVLDEFGYLRVNSNENSRSEEHTSELQSHSDLVCRLLLEKKKQKKK